MTKKMTRWLIAIGSLVIIGVAIAAVAYYRHDISRSIERASLPEEKTYQAASTPLPTPTPVLAAAEKTPPPTPSAIPAEVNLAVPFTVQAPQANWEDPYGELCEEASVLMAISYIRGEKIPYPETADTKLLEIKAFEEKRFGYYQDTTAAETSVIFKELYKYNKVRLIDNPTVDDIKKAVASGKLVLVPAAGRLLHNPYFQTPGPLYHMFVIKGYTKDGKFITNDPGTRRGADFLYPQDTVMNAMHDWHGDDHIEQGKRIVIVVG